MSTRTILLSALLLAALTARSSAQNPPAAPAGGIQAPAGPGQPAAQPPAPAAPAGPQIVVQDADASAGVATKGKDASGRETLSVDFPEEEIRGILRNVADLFELNIIIPETLTGKTSIKLRDVTWSQIYKAVLDPVGYTYVQDGNIIKIVSNESLLQEPVTTQVFVLNYATAGSLMPTISGMVGATAGSKIVVDARSNALVITAPPSALTKIIPIIDALDHATEQVVIETKFVEVTDGDVRNLGVDWSVLQRYSIGAKVGAASDRTRGQTISDSAGNGANSSGGTTNSQTATQNTSANNSASVTSNNGATTTTSSTGTTAGLTNAVSAGVTAATDTTLRFLQDVANTGSTNRTVNAVFNADQFGIVLSALYSLNSTKVVSNPTIMTLNNKEATINVGESDPIPKFSYNEQRGSFEVSGFDYKDIGINLKVTPQVNARGFITLAINPEVSQKNGSVNFGGASSAQIPIVATRKVTTNVSLASGQTVGIGGLITGQATNTGTKVPLLGDIPLLGKLFQSKSKNNSSTNLLIFITAKTVAAEGAPINQVFDSRQIRDMGLQRDELPGYRDGSDPFAPAPAGSPARK